MANIELKPGESFPHSHPFESYSCLIQGDVTLELNNESIPLVKNKKVIIPANTIHSISNTGPSTAIVCCSDYSPEPPDPTPTEIPL